MVTVVGYGVVGVAAAVMVNVAGPRSATSLADSISVDDPPATTVGGLNVAVTPAGRPDTPSATVWVEPSWDLVFTVMCRLPSADTVPADGVTDIVKRGAAPPPAHGTHPRKSR